MEFIDELALGEAWLRDFNRRVPTVTAVDVRDAVTKYLDPEQMAIAIVGDRGVIEKQLVKLRPVVP